MLCQRLRRLFAAWGPKGWHQEHRTLCNNRWPVIQAATGLKDSEAIAMMAALLPFVEEAHRLCLGPMRDPYRPPHVLLEVQEHEIREHATHPVPLLSLDVVRRDGPVARFLVLLQWKTSEGGRTPSCKIVVRTLDNDVRIREKEIEADSASEESLVGKWNPKTGSSP